MFVKQIYLGAEGRVGVDRKNVGCWMRMSVALWTADEVSGWWMDRRQRLCARCSWHTRVDSD